MTRDSMKDEILGRVLATIARTVEDHTGHALPPLSHGSSLDDLEIGSLTYIEVVSAIEAEFAVEILDEEFSRLRTVDDIVETVMRLREEAGAAGREDNNP
jgi:acyl carrier protein